MKLNPKPITKGHNENVLPFLLEKQGSGHGGILDGEIRVTSSGITIRLEGYGDAGTEAGYGAPIFIEHYDGALRVVLNPDINSEQQQIIEMEGALEERRTK